MARPGDSGPRRAAFGALATAIRGKDKSAILRLISERSTIQEDTDCHIWNGGRSDAGYPFVLRNPQVYVHRVISWTAHGFPGELAGFPPVHHLCAHTLCVNPKHLVPATSLTNSLEASVGKTLLSRIHALEEELVRVDPSNRLVNEWPPIDGGIPEGQLRAWRRNVSMGESLRRQRRREQYVAQQRARRQMRFDQVLYVRRLVGPKMTITQAVAQVGIARSTFDDWNRRYQQEIDSDTHRFVNRRI